MRKVTAAKGSALPHGYLILLGFIMMLSLGTVYTWSVFRIALEEVLHINSFQSGLPYMISLATYAVFMVITGKHLPYQPPQKVLLIGAAFVALGYGLSGFATNILWITLTFGLLAGAGVGIMYGVPLYAVATTFPEKRGLLVGLILTGFGISPLLTAPLVQALISQWGIFNTFKLLGLTWAILLPLLSLGYRSLPVAERPTSKPHQSSGHLIKQRQFQILFLLFFIGTFIGLSIIGLTKGAGLKWFSIDPRTLASLLGLFALFNGLGRPLFGYLTEKISPTRAIYLSFGSIAFAASLLYFAPIKSTGVFIIGFSILWLNLGGWLAIAPTTTLMLFGSEHYSRNYGLVFLAYGFGALLGVSITGLIIDYWNYETVTLVIAVLSLLGMFGNKFLTRKITQAIKHK